MTARAEATKPFGTARRGFGATLRRDRWWIRPATTAIVFTSFVLYSLFSSVVWAPVFGAPYEVDGYLSPFFSPLLFADVLPSWFSPAILILWVPLGFRTTCYYYRKAYYRAYFADPPACAVGEPDVHRGYAMEARFPFILQNIHRIFLYLALIPLAFLWIDALIAFRHDGAWRVGLGGILLVANVVLLSGYVLSCHSLRHLAGGGLDCFSCTARARVRHSIWQRLTTLNGKHGEWAWASLVSVVVGDLYIRLLGLGLFADPALRF